MYTYDLFTTRVRSVACACLSTDSYNSITASTMYKNINVTKTKTYIGIKCPLPWLKWYITITVQRSV